MSKLNPSPLIVTPNNDPRQLKRLSRTHTEFDEKYLQELLVENTALLPASEIRDDVGELLCIGREVTAGNSGSIDNLYLSTGGYPIIVETKLWRNPQARREVLSQVLDYIKEIVHVDYEWLEQQWKAFAKVRFNKESLLERLNSLSDNELEEEIFIDRVNRALRRGDVLAMIVGDGIETRLQELVSHLTRDSAHLRYSLALVELACYHLGEDIENDGMLVVPRIVKEVEPVERAYVRIEMAPDLEDQLAATSILDDSSDPRPRTKVRITLTEDDFLDTIEASIGNDLRRQTKEFYDDLIDTFNLEPDFKAASLMLKVPDPVAEKHSVSVIAFEKQGGIYNTEHMYSQLKGWGITRERARLICKAYWSELHEIDPGFLEDGIIHMNPRLFLPMKRIIDKFDLIKAAIGKVVKVIMAEADNSR